MVQTLEQIKESLNKILDKQFEECEKEEPENTRERRVFREKKSQIDRAGEFVENLKEEDLKILIYTLNKKYIGEKINNSLNDINSKHQWKFWFAECASEVLKDVGAASLFIHPCIDAAEQGSINPINEAILKPSWMHIMSLSIWYSGKYLEVCINNCKDIMNGKISELSNIKNKIDEFSAKYPLLIDDILKDEQLKSDISDFVEPFDCEIENNSAMFKFMDYCDKVNPLFSANI